MKRLVVNWGGVTELVSCFQFSCISHCTGAASSAGNLVRGGCLWMSVERDVEYKPNKQQWYKGTVRRKERPVRSTRSKAQYKEVIVVTDSEGTSSEEEIGNNTEQGGVGEARRLNHLNRNPEHRPIPIGSTPFGEINSISLFDGEPTSVSVKSEPCWSPHTVSRKTQSIQDQLSELQTHIAQAQMAQKKEMTMAEVFQQMAQLQMQRDERMETERRKEREDREAERKREQEERRRDMEEMRRERDEREEKVLLALKAAQPVVPQTVHIDNTHIPQMKKGEDVERFIGVFETAMKVARIPEDKLVSKLHGALDAETRSMGVLCAS